MTQVVLDIPTRKAEIARERRHATRLISEELEEIATEGHGVGPPEGGRYDQYVVSGSRRTSPYRVTVTVMFSPVVSAPSSASARSTYVPGSAKVTSTAILLSAGIGGANQMGAHGEFAPARVSSHGLI